MRYYHSEIISTGMAKLKKKQKIWQGCETTGTRILWVEMQSEKATLENSLATSCEGNHIPTSWPGNYSLLFTQKKKKMRLHKNT